jgi:hypothetical protein
MFQDFETRPENRPASMPRWLVPSASRPALPEYPVI